MRRVTLLKSAWWGQILSIKDTDKKHKTGGERAFCIVVGHEMTFILTMLTMLGAKHEDSRCRKHLISARLDCLPAPDRRLKCRAEWTLHHKVITSSKRMPQETFSPLPKRQMNIEHLSWFTWHWKAGHVELQIATSPCIQVFNVLIYLDQLWTTRPSLGCALHSIPCLDLGTSVLASCGTGSISLNTTLASSAHENNSA